MKAAFNTHAKLALFIETWEEEEKKKGSQRKQSQIS